MFLSRLILNPRSRDVRRDLSDCQQLHRSVMSAFPDIAGDDGARAALGVLHRIDLDRANVTLLVQSSQPPDWSHLPAGYLRVDTDLENPACKRLDNLYGVLRSGDVLAFRLRANPSRKIDTKSRPDGNRRNGRRVELRTEADLIDWLRRKGSMAGFEIVSVRARPEIPNALAMTEAKQRGMHPTTSGGKMTFRPVLFSGVLRVADADLFRAALIGGIGPAKAYGFGLLSVARSAE